MRPPLRQAIILLLLSAAALAVGLTLRSQFSERYPEWLVEEIQANLARTYERIEKEAARRMPDTVTTASPTWGQARDFFVRTDSAGIRAWTRNDYIPEASAWNGPDELNFFSSQRGDFLVKKWPLRDGYLVNILTLRDKYPIANAFLGATLNDELFPTRELDIVNATGSVGRVVRLNGRDLFRIVEGPREVRDSSWSMMFFTAGLLLLAAALFRGRKAAEQWAGPDITLLGLIGALYGIRLGMVRTGIPSTYFHADIFDPKVFASSELNASMGDLFFNGLSVLVLVLYLVRHYTGLRSVRWLLQQHVSLRFGAGVLCLLMALLGVLLSYNFIEVIYHNSTQSLDITQSLSFTWVRMTAFLSVLMGTASAFLFMHVMLALARHFIPQGMAVFLLAAVTAGALFVTQYTLTGNDNIIPLVGGLIMLVVIRGFGFERLEFTFSFRLFLYLVLSLTLFSIQHSITVRRFHTERMVQDQFRYAKDFLTERDVLAEYLLDRAARRIAADPFIQTRMASPFFSRNSVIDKIRRVHINRYFDRYELTINTRSPSDSLGIGKRFRPTDYPGIWYSANTAGAALKQYRVSIPVYYGRKVGYVELDLVLKRLLPDNVFPELLVDNRFSQLYRNRDFSYAVYRDGRLANSFGEYNYERDFDFSHLGDVTLYRVGLETHGFNHVAIDEGDGPVAVVSARSYSGSAVITNISFWFVLGLVVLFTIQAVFGALALAAGTPLALTARIQLYMFLAFALPMVTVSVTTLTLMGRTNEEATTREFLDRSVNAAERLTAFLAADISREGERLETWAAENANVVKTDISVYKPDGRLSATSQPSLFENQLLSTVMNREAYRRIVLQGERQAVTTEQIGTLQYNSAYAGVFSPQTGQLEAVISLPFFESATYFQKGQMQVLSNILKVFVVVFLVFTLLSFLAADRLAFPFRFIARTLRQTSFTGSNKPLTWEAKDEIGMLVSEYNRMVANLEESKTALARSEKESAWREMAKQVAHEIKNPLTPMKLTLQQMEKNLQEGPMGGDKVKKSLEVLLRQVEILNTIASSFSTFARMPALAPHRTDLTALVTQAVALFADTEDGVVQLKSPPAGLWVSVDPTALTRALSNVVINALQARVEGQKAVVSVEVVRNDGVALITIRDQGRGIPEELQERIFQPQFTTKESGSGLGLYMARQFVLQSGGKIWFESGKSGEAGTVFYIELPLSADR